MSVGQIRTLILLACLLFWLAAIGIYAIASAERGDGEIDHKSPDYYRTMGVITAESYLMNGVQKDSILCANKAIPGNFWAVSKAYHGRGVRTFARDKDASREKGGRGVCLHTTWNHYNHWAGVQNPKTKRIKWADGSSHD